MTNTASSIPPPTPYACPPLRVHERVPVRRHRAPRPARCAPAIVRAAANARDATRAIFRRSRASLLPERRPPPRRGRRRNADAAAFERRFGFGVFATFDAPRSRSPPPGAVFRTSGVVSPRRPRPKSSPEPLRARSTRSVARRGEAPRTARRPRRARRRGGAASANVVIHVPRRASAPSRRFSASPPQIDHRAPAAAAARTTPRSNAATSTGARLRRRRQPRRANARAPGAAATTRTPTKTRARGGGRAPRRRACTPRTVARARARATRRRLCPRWRARRSSRREREGNEIRLVLSARRADASDAASDAATRARSSTPTRRDARREFETSANAPDSSPGVRRRDRRPPPHAPRRPPRPPRVVVVAAAAAAAAEQRRLFRLEAGGAAHAGPAPIDRVPGSASTTPPGPLQPAGPRVLLRRLVLPARAPVPRRRRERRARTPARDDVLAGREDAPRREREEVRLVVCGDAAPPPPPAPISKTAKGPPRDRHHRRVRRAPRDGTGRGRDPRHVSRFVSRDLTAAVALNASATANCTALERASPADRLRTRPTRRRLRDAERSRTREPRGFKHCANHAATSPSQEVRGAARGGTERVAGRRIRFETYTRAQRTVPPTRRRATRVERVLRRAGESRRSPCRSPSRSRRMRWSSSPSPPPPSRVGRRYRRRPRGPAARPPARRRPRSAELRGSLPRAPR